MLLLTQQWTATSLAGVCSWLHSSYEACASGAFGHTFFHVSLQRVVLFSERTVFPFRSMAKKNQHQHQHSFSGHVLLVTRLTSTAGIEAPLFAAPHKACPNGKPGKGVRRMGPREAVFGDDGKNSKQRGRGNIGGGLEPSCSQGPTGLPSAMSGCLCGAANFHDRGTCRKCGSLRRKCTAQLWQAIANECDTCRVRQERCTSKRRPKLLPRTKFLPKMG